MRLALIVLLAVIPLYAGAASLGNNYKLGTACDFQGTVSSDNSGNLKYCDGNSMREVRPYLYEGIGSCAAGDTLLVKSETSVLCKAFTNKNLIK